MAEISYFEWVKEHSHNQQNDGEISPVKLRHSGLCDPFRVDIFATRDKKHGVCVRRSGEVFSGKLFLNSLLLRNIEISSTHCRNFKYDAGQEIRPEPTKSGDVSR